MTFAYCLRFDQGTEAAIGALWQVLVAGGGGDDMLQLGYAPHLTLATLDGAPSQAVLAAAFEGVSDLSAFDLTLGGIEVFAGTAIVWLAPAGTPTLAALHDRLLSLLPGALLGEHYRTGQWTPHVTLQMRGDAELAIALSRAAWPGEVSARVVALELVQFPPVTVLRSQRLAAGAPISPSSS